MNRSVLIAISMTVIVTGWVLSGLNKNEPEQVSSAATKADDPRLFSVQTRWLQASAMSDRLQFQGSLKYDRTATMSAELDAKVLNKYAVKGQRVSRGEKLVELDPSDLDSQLVKAKADIAYWQAELKSSQRLLAKKMGSESQFRQVSANLAAAQSELKRVQEAIRNTVISAPFTGIVNDLNVEVGEYLRKGDTVAVVIDDSTLVISARIPQQHIGKLKIGMPATATTLEGQTVEGHISYISAKSDPLTRSFEMEAKIDHPESNVTAGMSTKVYVDFEQIKAHKLSASLLSLDTEGNLQVKGVKEDNTVVNFPVKIVRNDRDGVWIKGLPERIQLITMGQGFVSAGEQVRPILIEPTSATALQSEKSATGDQAL